MTKNRSWCLPAGIVLAGLLACVFAAGFYYYYKYITPRILDDRLAEVGPPRIMVYAPLPGDRFGAGKSMTARATISANRPIGRVEIWLDGALADAQRPEAPSLTGFDASFELEIGDGTHIVSWRAVDTDGLVGQTSAIPITGVAAVAAAVDEAGENDQPVPAGAAGDQQPPEGNEPNAGQAQGGAAGAQQPQGGNLPDVSQPQGGGAGEQPAPNNNPPPKELPQGNLPGGGGAQGGGGAAQQPPTDNAPSPPLPEPGSGDYRMDPSMMPSIDWNRIIPGMPGLLRQLPAAPSQLEAGFEPCRVGLRWYDHAEDEDGFNVQMQTLGGPPTTIATVPSRPGTGLAWFSFPSPVFGVYSFWLEASNSLGSQPSEIAWVAVNDVNCGRRGPGTQLDIEALGMTIGGGFGDQMYYCYLSAEGFPERRVPEDKNEFLHQDAMSLVNIHDWMGEGTNRFLINIPADDELTLEGDCWAALGADYAFSMGDFSVSIPKEQWDNRPLQIIRPNYVIDYRIHPWGPTTVKRRTVFGYLDYEIPPPSIQLSGQTIGKEDTWIELSVSWYGDRDKLTYWMVYKDEARWGLLNVDTGGAPFVYLYKPVCGDTYEFQLAARLGSAESRLSNTVTFTQPPCPGG